VTWRAHLGYSALRPGEDIAAERHPNEDAHIAQPSDGQAQWVRAAANEEEEDWDDYTETLNTEETKDADSGAVALAETPDTEETDSPAVVLPETSGRGEADLDVESVIRMPDASSKAARRKPPVFEPKGKRRENCIRKGLNLNFITTLWQIQQSVATQTEHGR
jgi:hypothetical protein